MQKPQPQHADVLIHVHAAGITGDGLGYGSASRIPGNEISSTVAEVGPDYNGSFRVGDIVFALLEAERGAGQAEYVICSAHEIALKPIKKSHAEALALPIPILTAWKALFDHSNINSNSRVLITGASGAVGRFPVQFAMRVVGAQVVALASVRNHEMLQELGASEVIDYGQPGWEESLEKNVDAAFDTVGGEVLEKYWIAVKYSGSIVTVADPAPAWAFGRREAIEATEHPGVSYKFFIVSPSSERLGKIAQLIDNETVQAMPVGSYPLQEAERAWALARTRGRSSKLVISMIEDRYYGACLAL